MFRSTSFFRADDPTIGFDEDVLTVETVVNSLGNNFIFAQNSNAVYAATAYKIYRLEPQSFSGEVYLSTIFGSNDLIASVLSYESQFLDYTFDTIDGISLSPDEQFIAVSVRNSTLSEVDPQISMQVEVFPLDSLVSGTRRSDVEAFLTIPNATTATFSPDSRSIATNQGWYSLNSASLLCRWHDKRI